MFTDIDLLLSLLCSFLFISGINLFNFRRRAEREDERNRIRAKYGLATTSTGAPVTTSSHYQADKKADGGGCVLS